MSAVSDIVHHIYVLLESPLQRCDSRMKLSSLYKLSIASFVHPSFEVTASTSSRRGAIRSRREASTNRTLVIVCDIVSICCPFLNQLSLARTLDDVWMAAK